MEEERRKFERLRLDRPVDASLHALIGGKILDVSADGLLVRVQKRLDVGETYAVRLVFADDEVDVTGTVRRCRLAGFETDGEADRVRAYLAALEFERPVPGLTSRFRPGEALDVRMEPVTTAD